MNEVANELLKDVLDAYAQRGEERAREVWDRDVDLDELEDSVFRDLLTLSLPQNPQPPFAGLRRWERQPQRAPDTR